MFSNEAAVDILDVQDVHRSGKIAIPEFRKWKIINISFLVISSRL